ncbi:hypothetical protein MD535_08135 [Vibrio sp. ZSDZ65]|uniref:Uncharacterized protein n=1 Tax=Vibrio qingdaonensis TaxID=2829491 RepID=A0A9X3CP71_9VIBR|nr:hypothetical protein [Vibrio qingdaonensis]MCW8345975.1 hypothetical protein [Vibrio qingdaonensis]
MQCLVNGQLTQDTIMTCKGHVLLEPVDVMAVQSFDQELYLEVSGYLLLSFLIGHGTGRVVRWMGKV